MGVKVTVRPLKKGDQPGEDQANSRFGGVEHLGGASVERGACEGRYGKRRGRCRQSGRDHAEHGGPSGPKAAYLCSRFLKAHALPLAVLAAAGASLLAFLLMHLTSKDRG